MGNIGSQIGNSSHKYKIESERRQLSLPRIINQQQRVLPTKEPLPKLRSTQNGKILHDGGTLTGRQPLKISHGNYMNVKEKIYLLKELHDNNKSHIHKKEQLKKCGSEPDLRYHLNQEKLNLQPNRFNCTKKLNQLNSLEKQQNEMENWENNNHFTKRTGLFKTRAESKNQPFSIINNRSPTIIKRNKLNKLTKTNDYRRSLPELQKDLSLTGQGNNFNEDTERMQEVTTDVELPSKETRDAQVETNEIYFQEANMKKYYFGMTNNVIDQEYLNYDIEDYKLNLSDIIPDESNFFPFNNLDDSDNGSQKISLHLRPILPKKQLEIPKFSSTNAWKLLYSVDSDSNLECSIITDDLIEERIEKVSTLPPRLSKSIDFQSSQDKSGDSGISGDETPKPTLSHYKSKQSWTPQQDLGDDSSTDEEVKFNSVPYFNAKKPHVFSLSLPRDHLSSQYTLEKYKSQSYLQTTAATNKLKRSVSGVLGGDDNVDAYTTKNCNWLLSKSAPNSLNNGFNSLENTYIYNEALTSLVPVSNHNTKGRIMYLPDSGNMIQKLENQEKGSNILKFTAQNIINTKKNVRDDLLEEIERKEQERLQEIEAMQRIEEEFRRKRSRYTSLYPNNQQDFRKAMLSIGEKSV